MEQGDDVLPPKNRIWVYLLAPFGAAPFYGYPKALAAPGAVGQGALKDVQTHAGWVCIPAGKKASVTHKLHQ